MPSQRQETYWAAAETEEAVREIDARITRFYDAMRTSRQLDLWRQAYFSSYSGMRSLGRMGIAGELGEYTTLEMNEYGNLKSHVLNLITGQRPHFQAKARNSDHRSQSQALLGNSIMETVMRDRDLEAVAGRCADFSQTYGEGWIWKVWDSGAGTEFRGDPTTGEIEMTGDVVYRGLDPMNVVRDTMMDDCVDPPWLVARAWENRYDLLARYGVGEDPETLEVRRQILAAPTKREVEGVRPRICTTEWSSLYSPTQETDEVAVWHFYHKRCDSLPEGRMMVFLTPRCVLHDGTMPYREIPLYRMAPIDVHNTPLGYTGLFDVLAPNQALNSLMSSVISNHASFGQSIWVPAGANLSWQDARGGLKVIEGGTVKPEPLNLVATPAEVFTLMELLKNAGERYSGVNSVARGEPEASLKSGAALALVQSQAIQFLALSQKAYIKTLERVATATVRDYQDFASLPHVVTIVGQANRQYVQEFTSSDIDQIDRITVEVANPLMATVAGRYNMAEMMLSNGLIKTPEQLHMVLAIGRLDPVTQGAQRELMNLAGENERLSFGQPCSVMVTDNHPLHIQENSSVLDSPEARENPEVVRVVTEHLFQHAQAWATAPAPFLVAKGIPMAPMMNPAMLPPAPGGPEGANGQAPQGPRPGQPGASDQGFPLPQMPMMPKNPMTGDRAEPPQGPSPGESFS